MTKNVLAVSSQPAFGELLRISLEKSGNYRVKLLHTGSEVLSVASRDVFDLAILDADLKDQPIVPLVQNLRLQQPQIKIIVIPSAVEAVQHTLAVVKVDGFLPRPFNLADLMQLAERLTVDNPIVPFRPPSAVFQAPEGHSPIDTKWIEDLQQVQQNMFRLSLQSPTLGAFLFQGNELHAQASKLDHQVDHQVVEIFLKSWDKKSSMDLVKFFRDKVEKKKWLLYATILLREYILVMIFPAALPMHEVRGHVIRMANGLSNASQSTQAPDDVMKFLGNLEDKVQEEQVDQDIARAPKPVASAPAIQIPPQLPIVEPSRVPAKGTSREIRISCVLTLRLTALQFAGEFAERIRHWIAEICNVKKWVLVELDVQPAFLLCSVRVGDQEEPVDMASHLRSRLTDLIYKLYPLLRTQGDLWETNEMLINEGLPPVSADEEGTQEMPDNGRKNEG
jgi:ActR/RegA family two-component response regulator